MQEIKQIELAYRRLIRAKAILDDELIIAAQAKEATIYIATGQTHPDKHYLIGKGLTCGCRDDFKLDGHKRCKHTLAAMMLAGGMDTRQIGKDPFYDQLKEARNGTNAVA